MKFRLMKLSGGSEKQFADCRGIYELPGALLDQDYIQHWAAKLDVIDLWQRLQREAEPLVSRPRQPVRDRVVR